MKLTKTFLEIDHTAIFLQILCKIVPQLLSARTGGFQRKSVYYLMNNSGLSLAQNLL